MEDISPQRQSILIVEIMTDVEIVIYIGRGLCRIVDRRTENCDNCTKFSLTHVVKFIATEEVRVECVSYIFDELIGRR